MLRMGSLYIKEHHRYSRPWPWVCTEKPSSSNLVRHILQQHTIGRLVYNQHLDVWIGTFSVKPQPHSSAHLTASGTGTGLGPSNCFYGLA